MDRIERLLAPTDFSAVADQAVRYACGLAARLGAKVDLLHVYRLPALPDGVPTVSALEKVVRRAEEELERVVSWCDPGVLGERILTGGDPRFAIIEMAEELDSDLIVMGSHGARSLLRSGLDAGVTETVTRNARCPVLTMCAQQTLRSQQQASSAAPSSRGTDGEAHQRRA